MRLSVVGSFVQSLNFQQVGESAVVLKVERLVDLGQVCADVELDVDFVFLL